MIVNELIEIERCLLDYNDTDGARGVCCEIVGGCGNETIGQVGKTEDDPSSINWKLG